MEILQLSNFEIAEFDAYNISKMKASDVCNLPEFNLILKQRNLLKSRRKDFKKALFYLKVAITQN